MLFMRSAGMLSRAVPICVGTSFLSTPGTAHEAWLLTPTEVEVLARQPMPAIFTSYTVLGLAALIGCAVTMVALYAETRAQPLEARFEPRLKTVAAQVGPIVMRVAIAVMIALAAVGGLPRHGTAPWTQPTLLVPDMQLSLVAGWDWLAPFQLALAALLLVGLFTRLMGVVLIGLAGLGLIVFKAGFLAYAPHFAAPGLILALFGAGRLSLDQLLGVNRHVSVPVRARPAAYRLAQILVGAGFVYLAAVYKLTQPTLLIAILQHGQLPSFGLPYPVIALIMTGVEIICGALLIAGRLVRPVSVVIIGAITFLALTLGETPLFHANLYGTIAVFALAGRSWLRPAPAQGAAA